MKTRSVTRLENNLRKLPRELLRIIDTFNVNHRKQMIHVFDEMLYNASLTFCGNDMCEQEISIYDAIETKILGHTYHFCDNNYCEGYGEWSIRYDYRKFMRRQRQQGQQTTAIPWFG